MGFVKKIFPGGGLECREESLPVPFSIQFDEIEDFIQKKFPNQQILRFVSSRFDKKSFQAHVLLASQPTGAPGIFQFKQRKRADESQFNACFLIPTGIGCEIGGHAGDGTPALKLIAGSCNKVITHPNVVNASDINEMPPNALYVEGSHLTQFLMGAIGLLETRTNKTLAIIDSGPEREKFADLAVNSVNSARITLGMEIEACILDSKIQMESIVRGNKAAGKISKLNYLMNLLEEKASQFDAVAVTSSVKVPEGAHEVYSKSNGEMVNPWGGVESMLTHVISSKLRKPSAHAPMFENSKAANLSVGVVDPRIAPEIVSATFFHCVLKGLCKAPKIAEPHEGISVKDIAAVIIPDGALGLPVLAALRQGLKVIAVKNKNTMKNDLSQLPWGENQFFQCESYIEACGILNCLKQGIDAGLVKRPVKPLKIHKGAAAPAKKRDKKTDLPASRIQGLSL